ncbi:MAG: AtpZ/AtpI family protein [Parachlamydiaceae bacterium]|nr:AtpZ/AtpI family protein [Parachlamydiaceae bacterium]
MGAFITIPFVLAVPPVIGWLIGNWLDKTFDMAPVFMLSLILLGFIAGFREAYRIIKKFGEDV